MGFYLALALLICLAAIFFFILCIRVFLVIITVEGYSMYPTMLPGDRLLVLRRWSSKWLRKNQIVIGDLGRVLAKSEDSRSLSSNMPVADQALGKFVKRLVGLPKDTITIHISELYEGLRDEKQGYCDADGNLIWHVPAGHGFVRGDSLFSRDSVQWGPISFNDLSGIVLMKLPSKSGAESIRVDGEYPSIFDYLATQEKIRNQGDSL